MAGSSRSRKSPTKRSNPIHEKNVGAVFIDTKADESDGEGGAVSSELSEWDDGTADAGNSSMDGFVVPDGTHEEEAADALDFAEAGINAPERDEPDQDESVHAAGRSADAAHAQDEDEPKPDPDSDVPVIVPNPPQTPKRKRVTHGTRYKSKEIINDDEDEPENLEAIAKGDSMWTRGSAVKSSTLPPALKTRRAAALDLQSSPEVNASPKKKKKTLQSEVREDIDADLAASWPPTPPKVDSGPPLVPSTPVTKGNQSTRPAKTEGEAAQTNAAEVPAPEDSGSMSKTEMKDYILQMFKEQGPVLAQAVMADVLPAIAKTMRDNAPRPAPVSMALSPSPLPEPTSETGTIDKEKGKQVLIPLNDVFSSSVDTSDESPRQSAAARSKTIQASASGKAARPGTKLIDVSFDGEDNTMTVIPSKPTSSKAKAGNERGFQVKAEVRHVQSGPAKKTPIGTKPTFAIAGLEGLFGGGNGSASEEEEVKAEDATDNGSTAKAPKKKIKYLEDLECYKVNYKPGMVCEVFDEDLQDPLLVSIYEGLPALPKRHCHASYTADGEFVLQEGQKGGRVPFSRWPKKVRNITQTTISTAMTFRRKGVYMNPSRESPAEITVKPLRPASASKRLNVKEGVAVCVSAGMCTASHVTVVQETRSNPVLRFKSIQIMLHDQCWERWEAFMAFCFGYKFLFVNMTNLAIQVATNRVKAAEEAEDNENDALADMRSPVRQSAGSSKATKKYELKHSLNPDDKIPVFDATTRDFDFHTEIDNYASLPEWEGEIPIGSFIVTGYTASTYKGKAANHTMKQEHVGANLLWVIVCGTPK